MKLNRQFLAFIGVWLWILVQANAYAEEDKLTDAMRQKEKATLYSKLRLLDNIVFKSSRARAVSESGNEKAISILRSAQQHYERARELLKEDKLAQSKDEIHKGLNLVSVAFRLVADERNENLQAKQRYEELLEGIKSYREAFNQVASEKGEKVASLLDSVKMDRLIEQAESLAKENRYKEASKALFEASSMLEMTLSKARKNETLVYELKFDTPEDEYDYELKRNKNYVLLAEMLLATCPPDKVKRIPLIKRLMGRNEELVAKSEQLLEQGDVDAAIKAVEKGTQTLARALRLGGLAL